MDGAFLVDSFFYMKDGKTKVEYLPELLADLWRDTGLVFMAVCSGGAALTNPTKWTVTFDELLDRVPASVRMIIPIVCGNDILVNWKVPTFRDAWATAAERLCEGMRAKSAVQFAVVGGSSDVWRYDTWMELGQRELYDANARQLAGVFSACGVHATTGAGELQGMEIADDTGHVSWDSRHVVFGAYPTWVRQCLRCEAALELSELVEQEQEQEQEHEQEHAQEPERAQEQAPELGQVNDGVTG